jgi:putative ABC transport system permease protein
MWLKKLRKKKLQYALVAIILFLTAAIFSACLCFTVEANIFAKNYYSKGKSPDYFIDIGGGNASGFLSKAKDNKDFTKVTSIKGKAISEKLEDNGNNVTPPDFYFYAIDNVHSLSWSVSPEEYIKKESKPAMGEIWVTKVYADLKNIRLGDKILIKNAQQTTLTVSAIIDDATCTSTLMGTYPFYVSNNTLNEFANDTPVTFVTISSQKGEDSIHDWLRTLPDNLENAITEKYTVSILVMSFDMLSNLLGAIGIMSALLIFVVSIIIIRFLIKSNLMKEYHSIGIYKAVGFTDGQIQGFYFRCYFLVGAISLLLGAAGGVPIGYAIDRIIMKYASGFHLTSMSVLMAFSTALLLYALLILNVKLAYGRIKRITPVDALQIGMTSTKKKLTRSVLPNAKSPLAMAVNDIFKHKSFSVMFLLILTVSFYLCIVFTSINYSCSHIQNNLPKWFGTPKSDCFITGQITSEELNYIKNSSYTSGIVYGTPFVDYTIKNEKNKYGVDLSNCAFLSWNEFNNKGFWIPCKIGRAPQNSGEIAISSGTVKGTSLTVGDYVDLIIGQQKKSFLVTGIYDSMVHASKTIEILPDDLKSYGESIAVDSIAVDLKNPSDFNAFKIDVQNHFKTITIEQQYSEISDSAVGVEEMTSPVTEILVIVFILFSLINILNLSLTQQLDNRRKFGILKSLGFTTGYICRQNLYETILLSLVSIVLALSIHFAFSAKMFDALVGVNTLVNNAQLLSVLIAAIFAMIIIISMMFCISLRKISPVDLMEE